MLLFEHSAGPTTRLLGASTTQRVTGDRGRKEQVAGAISYAAANDPLAPRGCAELHKQVEYIRSLAALGAHGTYTAMTGSAASH